ncbi:MAG: DUF2306 domain-containing protein [Planctomycetota bacterium]
MSTSVASPRDPSVPAAVLPSRLRPGIAWWLLAVTSTAIGGYGMALQDGRPAQDTVPGLPWLDEAHFFAGGAALALGPFAFRRDLLARATAWHRRLGWLYVIAALVSGAAGAAMACTSMAGLVAHLGFGGLAAAWLTTTALGVRAIQRRAVTPHRRWMVLSFACCYAAVTLRIQLPALTAALGSFEAGYRAVSWSCWVPNLVFACWWLSRTDATGRRRRPIATPT